MLSNVWNCVVYQDRKASSVTWVKCGTWSSKPFPTLMILWFCPWHLRAGAGFVCVGCSWASTGGVSWLLALGKIPFSSNSGTSGTFPLSLLGSRGIPGLGGSAGDPGGLSHTLGGAGPRSSGSVPQTPQKEKKGKTSKCVWRTWRKAEFPLILKASLSGGTEARPSSFRLFVEVVLPFYLEKFFWLDVLLHNMIIMQINA